VSDDGRYADSPLFAPAPRQLPRAASATRRPLVFWNPFSWFDTPISSRETSGLFLAGFALWLLMGLALADPARLAAYTWPVHYPYPSWAATAVDAACIAMTLWGVAAPVVAIVALGGGLRMFFAPATLPGEPGVLLRRIGVVTGWGLVILATPLAVEAVAWWRVPPPLCPHMGGTIGATLLRVAAPSGPMLAVVAVSVIGAMVGAVLVARVDRGLVIAGRAALAAVKFINRAATDSELEVQFVPGAANDLAANAASAGALGEPGAAEPKKAAAPRKAKKTERVAPGTPDMDDRDAMLPPMSIFNRPKGKKGALTSSEVSRTSRIIEETLESFKVPCNVVEHTRGPRITLYEVRLAPGINVSRLGNLSDNLAMALRAPAVRIIAPISGKDTIGIEVPNRKEDPVVFREILEEAYAQNKIGEIPLIFGRTGTGELFVDDLARLPHLLIAGTTGSGKSVCTNAILAGTLAFKKPDDVRMILIDPKQVELSLYNGIPHLEMPVVTDMKQAPAVLNWCVEEMERRYNCLSKVGVRNLAGYNALATEKKVLKQDDEGNALPDKFPLFLVIVDELADLMMVAAKEVETSITRLAQKSRAVGIHLVLATQRPSVDVITGLIKANMPARVSFKVSSKIDSRTILDQGGAQGLLGRGDMFALLPGSMDLVRAHGAYLSDEEIRNLCEHWRTQDVETAKPREMADVTHVQEKHGRATEDPIFIKVADYVVNSGNTSPPALQREFGIGYNRASKLIDQLEAEGVLGPHLGQKGRELLLDEAGWAGKRLEFIPASGVTDMHITFDSGSDFVERDFQQGGRATSKTGTVHDTAVFPGVAPASDDGNGVSDDDGPAMSGLVPSQFDTNDGDSSDSNDGGPSGRRSEPESDRVPSQSDSRVF
jgi:hypothetical protein